MFFQGFFTPPEEEADYQIPALPHFNPNQLGNLPPELIPRGNPKWSDVYSSPDSRLPYRLPLSDYNTAERNAGDLTDRLERSHIDDTDQGSTGGGGPPPQASNWSRSYQNPVGTIYYPPSEPDDRWSHWQAGQPSQPVQDRQNSVTPCFPMFLPAGPMFHDPRQNQQSLAMGAYHNSPKAPLAFYLPRMGPYRDPSPRGSQHLNISPKSGRSANSHRRPISADVGQLFRVEENDTTAKSQTSFKKGMENYFYFAGFLGDFFP